MLGGRKSVFLAITVSPMVYAALSATPFEKSLNPGLAPRIPPNSTIIEQTVIRYKFTLETELYLLHTNMDKSLKKTYGGHLGYICPGPEEELHWIQESHMTAGDL